MRADPHRQKRGDGALEERPVSLPHLVHPRTKHICPIYDDLEATLLLRRRKERDVDPTKAPAVAGEAALAAAAVGEVDVLHRAAAELADREVLEGDLRALPELVVEAAGAGGRGLFAAVRLAREKREDGGVRAGGNLETDRARWGFSFVVCGGVGIGGHGDRRGSRRRGGARSRLGRLAARDARHARYLTATADGEDRRRHGGGLVGGQGGDRRDDGLGG